MSTASHSPVSAEELSRRKQNREAFAEALRSEPGGVEGLKAVRQSLHYASIPLPENSDSTFVHPGEETLRLTLEHMEKVNEDYKAGRGLPDVLARTGPQKLGRRFVRNPPSGLVSWFKKWFKR